MIQRDAKYYMDRVDYYKKFGKWSNKCQDCRKHYGLPTYIFYPRQKICFTCEVEDKKFSAFEAFLGGRR